MGDFRSRWDRVARRRGRGGGGGRAPSGIFRPAAGWLRRMLSGSRRSYRYDMVNNPGPLASMPGNPAANFAGGRYNELTLPRDTTLYRGGTASQPYGRWFTADPPASRANVRIDSAVPPTWTTGSGGYVASSPVDSRHAIQLPAGTRVYHGPVANQGGIYHGGGEQIYVPAPWAGGRVVGSEPLP